MLIVTGFINLMTAGAARRFVFSTAFMTVLAIKIALFIVMIVVMMWSMRVGAVIKSCRRARTQRRGAGRDDGEW